MSGTENRTGKSCQNCGAPIDEEDFCYHIAGCKSVHIVAKGTIEV